MTLTPKQARFVDEYLIDLNATQAAIRAGYSERTANEQGSRLLANVSVAAAIAERRQKLAEKAGVTQERIVAELARIGFADIRKAIKWNGHLIREEDTPDGGDVLVIKETRNNLVSLVDSEELDDDTAAAVSAVTQNAQGGVSLKMHDKQAALVNLGKHLGMFVEKHEHAGPGGKPIEMRNVSHKERARAMLHVLHRAKKGDKK
jgi:phage terminase small subunit